MLTNIFNSSGVSSKTHILNCEGDKIFFGSSSNIIIYKDEKMWPILRDGGDITHLKVRNGIILCDSENQVEINQKFYFSSNETITAVSKTDILNDQEYNLAVFTTLKTVYVVSGEKYFKINLENVVSLDCGIIDEYFVVFCGDLHGNVHKIEIFLKDFEISSDVSTTIDVINRFLNDSIEMKPLEEIKPILHKIQTNKIHTDTVSSVNFTKKWLITCSHDSTIKILALEDLQLIDTLIGHADIVYDCFYDSEKNQILSIGADNTVITWEFSNGWKDVARVGNKNNFPFFGVVKFTTGQDEIVYVQDYHGSLYKYINNQLKESLSGHCGKVTSCDLNDKFLVTGSSDFTVRLFANDREIARPVLHGYPIHTVSFHNDNIVIGSEETIIRVFEQTEAIRKMIESEKNEIENVQIATPSELSLTNELKKVDKIELNEHSLQNILCYKERKKLYGQFFLNSALASNERMILFSNKSANFKFSGIFVVFDLKVVQYIAVHTLGITKIEISPDSKYVLAVSRDRCVSKYEVVDDEKFVEEESETLINRKMCDSTAFLRFVQKSKVHERAINSLCLNSDGTLFCTTSKDKTVKIFNFSDLSCLKTIYLEKEAFPLRFFRDLLLVGQEDGTLAVFSSKYELVHSIKAHSKKINEIKCSNDLIATIGDDWLVRTYAKN